MSKTPRTDAQCDLHQFDPRQWYDFTRQLETELNEARANAFEEAAEMASPCSGFVYGKDLRAKADSIRKGEER